MIQRMMAQWSASAVLFREASRTSRQWQTYASRCFFSGMLMAILLAAVGVVVSDPDFLDPAQMGKYGRGVFAVFALLQVVLAIGLAPLIVSNAIIQERQSKQLELIGLTSIGPGSLFAGLVFSRLLLLYTIVLGALPVMALVVQLGGVSVLEIVVVIVHTLVACTILGTMGGVYGLFTRSSTLAILPTTIFALAVFLILPAGYSMATANPWASTHLSPFAASQAKDWWSLLPVIAYLPVLYLLLTIGKGIFANHLRGLDIRKAYRRDIWHPKRFAIFVGLLLLSSPLLAVAMAMNIALQISSNKSGTKTLIGPIEDWVIGSITTSFSFLWAMGLMYAATWLFLRLSIDMIDAFDQALFGRRRSRRRRRGKGLRVWRNPVLWHELGGGALVRLGLPLWLSWCLLLLALVQTGLWIIPGSILFLSSLNIALAIGFTVWWSGERIRKDQRSGVLEVLLTTTIPRRRIVFGKMVAGLVISGPLMVTSGFLLLLGVLQFDFFMSLFQKNRPFDDMLPQLVHGVEIWVWALGLWFFSASLGCYTAARTANPRTSFVLAATVLSLLVAIPAALGNLLPDSWVLPELSRYIAPGVVAGSGLHHLGVSFLLALITASLLTTKTVRHLGRALVPLIVIGLCAPQAIAQEFHIGARPLGDGLVRTENWSAVDVQLRNPGPDTVATISLHTNNALGHAFEREVALPSGAQKQVRVPFYVGSNDQVRVQAVTQDRRLAEGVVPLNPVGPASVSIGIIGEDPLGITAIFETWTLGVPGRVSRVPIDDARRVRTSLFSEQTFPTTAAHLASYDMLIWPQAQPEDFTQAQLESLRYWVANGGHLVLSVTDTWRTVKDSSINPMLPAELEGLGEHEDWTDAFIPFPFKAPPPTKAPVVHATLKKEAHGLSMLDTSHPLWSIGGYGDGSVTLFLADVNVAPFGANKHRATFWRTVLWLPKPGTLEPTGPEQKELVPLYDLLHLQLNQPPSRRQIDKKKLREKLADIPGISPWPIRWLLLFSGAYLLLIGPIDYLVLRLIGRQPLTWITFPSVIVLFSAAALLSAKLTKGSQSTGIRLEKIDLIPGTSVASGGSYLSLYATAKSEISVSSAIAESQITPLAEPNFVNQATTSADQDKHRFHYKAETWTLAYLKTQWVTDLNGTLDLSPTEAGLRLTNNLDFPLEGLFILNNNTWIAQGDLLLPGEAIILSLEGTTEPGLKEQGRNNEQEERETDTGTLEEYPEEHIERLLFPTGIHVTIEQILFVAELSKPYESLEIEGIQPTLTTVSHIRMPVEKHAFAPVP
jgi:hypothetical protein